jgi:ribosome maturation factor RimP
MESKIEKIINSYGASLYDIELVNENGSNIYRVYITKDGGVDLDLCAQISNDISPLLDLEPPVKGEYFLEVSSPGIERKLSKPKHFQNSINERVKLKVADVGKKKGILKSADEEKISIQTKDGLEEFEYSQINSAKTYFDWANESKK